MQVNFLFIVALASKFAAGVNGAIANNEENTHQLQYWGTVDGLGYWTESDMKRNWTLAKWFCESNGLHLATFTTQRQYNFLFESIKNTTEEIFTVYWTGARDWLVKQAFVWESNRAPIPDFATWTKIDGPPYFCGGMIYWKDAGTYMTGYECSQQQKAICSNHTVTA